MIDARLKLVIAAIFGIGAIVGAASLLIYDDYQKRKKLHKIPVNKEEPFKFKDHQFLYIPTESEFSDEEFFSLSEGEDSDDFEASDLKIILKKIDSLFNRPGNINNCIKELDNASVKFADNCEIYWRLSKCYHHLHSLEKENKDLKKSYNEKAIKYGEKAIHLDKNNYNAHKWYGIALGASTDYATTKDKILNGFVFQKHIETALSLNPEDYSLYHLLGRFKYEVSRLSWFERSIASTLFANPPNATYSEALEHFIKAEEMNANPWKENKLFIAKSHYAMGNKSLSKDILEEALNYPNSTEEDNKINEEIIIFLKNIY